MSIQSLCCWALRPGIGCALILASSTATAQDTRTGTTTTTTRTSTTSPTRVLPKWEPNLSSLLASTSSSSFVIPGGGDVLNTQLWFKLTKLIANTTTDDASPDDEVYAIVGIIVLNWERLWESKVYVRPTRIYGDMNSGDFRSVNLELWGQSTDPTIAVRSAKDLIVRISLYEQDDGNPLIAAAAAQALVAKEISGLNPGFTHAQVYEKLSHAFYSAIWQNATVIGDDVIGGYVTQGLYLTDDDLQSARNGTVVKKEKIFVSETGDERGKYTLRFQLGKEGLSSVAW